MCPVGLLQSASAINVAPLHATTERECVTASQVLLDDSVTSVRWEEPCDSYTASRRVVNINVKQSEISDTLLHGS